VVAKTTNKRQFDPVTHISKSAKNQKGKPNKMDLPLMKNDIT